MELGNILGKLKGQEKQEPKKFLALILTDEVVQAAVWSVISEQTEIIALGTPVEWDGDTGTTTELITAVDATISSATEGLGDEPSEVILGIPHSWTDKDEVLGVKKEFINKIRKELDLQALGYVEITTSILSYLKMKEGTPTTSILIQVNRDELTLVLVRLGRIEGIENIGRSDDVVEDVTEGIVRFKIADNLPSRIILFNSMHNLDDIIQNLLSVDWQTQFNFLHTPKIEALPKDVAIQALAVAGGSEVAKSLGFSVSDQVIDVPDPNVPITPGVKGSHTPGVSVNPNPTLLSAQEIGFTDTAKPDFIGPDDEPVINPSNPGVKGSHTPGLSAPPRIPFVFPQFHLPKFHLPHPHLNLSSVKRHWWIAGGALTLVAILVFSLVWLLPSAILTVTVIPKTLDQDVELTLSTTDSEINFADKVVPAQIDSVEESGEKMIETTGEKIIGDPAKGEVVIYNRTSSSKTFAKGVSLAFGTLKFTLDEDVTIASKSAGSDYVDVPGKASVLITSSSIGENSNLPSGTEFTLASFSKDSYVAKNEEALTGGTEETVQVVSKDDQKLLLTSLTEELLEKIKSNTTGDSNSGTGIYLIPDSAKVQNDSYSARVGETAKNLSLSITVKVSLLKYNTQDVTTLVNSEIDQAVPPGYTRANLPSTVELSARIVEGSGESVKGKAKVKVALLPLIDNQALQSSLKGKSAAAIGGILTQSIPGYQSALVEITPSWLPTRFKLIPYNPKNILLTITPLAE